MVEEISIKHNIQVVAWLLLAGFIQIYSIREHKSVKNVWVGEECSVNLMTVVASHVQCVEKRGKNFAKVEDSASTEEAAIILKRISTIMNKL